MTREYPKDHKHNNDEHPKPAADFKETPPMKDGQRTVPISTIHDQEIEKARTDIAELVLKARQVEVDREDPLIDRPEIEFINELQAIFKQIHHLNARWLAGPGYEAQPSLASVRQPGVTDAPPPATPDTKHPVEKADA